jgi:hypothetical protein
LHCFLGADEPDTAVRSVAKGLDHRSAAPAEGNPRFAFGARLSSPFGNRDWIAFVIDEVHVAVNPVWAILANLDRDVCHYGTLESELKTVANILPHCRQRDERALKRICDCYVLTLLSNKSCDH